METLSILQVDLLIVINYTLLTCVSFNSKYVSASNATLPQTMRQTKKTCCLTAFVFLRITESCDASCICIRAFATCALGKEHHVNQGVIRKTNMLRRCGVLSGRTNN